jgi:hypothetical protein
MSTFACASWWKMSSDPLDWPSISNGFQALHAALSTIYSAAAACSARGHDRGRRRQPRGYVWCRRGREAHAVVIAVRLAARPVTPRAFKLTVRYEDPEIGLVVAGYSRSNPRCLDCRRSVVAATTIIRQVRPSRRRYHQQDFGSRIKKIPEGARDSRLPR